MGICEEKSDSKVISDTFSYTLGSGTCYGHMSERKHGHMSERKHHKKEKQLILDSYTNEREDGQRIEMKGVSAASEV